MGRQPPGVRSTRSCGCCPTPGQPVDAGTLDDTGAGCGATAVCERLIDGEFDDGRPPARIHGDLWAGNVLYARGGVVLIDPAAHGGHGQTDLAMLELFGLAAAGPGGSPAYAEAAELPAGLGDRTGPAPAAPAAGARRIARRVLRTRRRTGSGPVPLSGTGPPDASARAADQRRDRGTVAVARRCRRPTNSRVMPSIRICTPSRSPSRVNVDCRRAEQHDQAEDQRGDAADAGSPAGAHRSGTTRRSGRCRRPGTGSRRHDQGEHERASPRVAGRSAARARAAARRSGSSTRSRRPCRS